MKKSEFIPIMARGMAKVEGFLMTPFEWTNVLRKKLPPDWKKEGDPITVAQRCNNPGNLRSWGKLPQGFGFAIFPTPEEGWKALHRQCELNIYGSDSWSRTKTNPMSLFEFFAGQRDTAGKVLPKGYPGYAPAADKNSPTIYAGAVLDYLKKHVPGFPAAATIYQPIRSFITE